MDTSAGFLPRSWSLALGILDSARGSQTFLLVGCATSSLEHPLLAKFASPAVGIFQVFCEYGCRYKLERGFLKSDWCKC